MISDFKYFLSDDVRKTPNICSQFYPGAKPFSTAEAKVVRQYIHKLGDTVHLAIHLHASYVPKKVNEFFYLVLLKLQHSL